MKFLHHHRGSEWHTTAIRLFVAGWCIMVSSFESFAQQEWQYTQYFFNLYDINSAYAGNHGQSSFAARYRRQWPGVEGAPETQAVSMHLPVKNTSLGMGGRLVHETIGARSSVGIQFTAAFKMRLKNGTLSAGAGLGVVREQLDLTQLSIRDADDLVPLQDNRTYTYPLAHASLLYNTTTFWAGTEISRVNPSRTGWANSSDARLYYHINTTGGLFIPVTTDDLVKVSAILRYTEGGFWNAETSAAFLLNNILWMGAGYRIAAGPVVYTEINLSARLRLGYSYDLARSNSFLPAASHEVFLGFNPGKNERSSIRFFQ